MPRVPAVCLTPWIMFAVVLPIGLVAFDAVSMSYALMFGFVLSAVIISTARVARRMTTTDCWCMSLIGLAITAIAFPLAVTVRGVVLAASGGDGRSRADDLLGRYVEQIQGPFKLAMLACAAILLCGIIFHKAWLRLR